MSLGAANATAVIPKTDVELQANFVDTQLDLLWDSINDLIDVAAPLLTPAQCEDTGGMDGIKSGPLSEIGQRLRNSGDRMEALRYRVNAIRNRL